MIDLDAAVELVHETSFYRVPEAIRRADGGSREVLRRLEAGEGGEGKESGMGKGGGGVDDGDKS